MSFYSSSSSAFSAIAQPKVRQEGFHLPSPSPSTGHPPSPPPGPFDLFLTHSSHHAHQGGNNSNGNSGSGSGGGSGSLSGGSGGGLPSLSLPDAFSRSNAMDLTDELAMSLMNPASPATSNERSTHTPPAHQGQGHGTEQTHMHNIFDISAPPSSHFTGAGGHAFSLPQSSHRPDLPPLSQPASLATSHLHGHYDQQGNYHGHSGQNGFLGGRDTFPAHFNSTIPPLSSHHDPHPPSMALSASGTNDLTDPFGPFTPTSASSIPARDSESPQPLGGGTRKRADSRSATGSGRSPSRSRSRVRTTTASQSQSQGGGPTRTTKSASRRRDSFTLPPHLTHSHSHSHSHSLSHTQTQLGHHLHNLPSPPLGGSGSAPRPSSIVIPPHSVPGGALSPLGNMGGLGSALSPLGPNGSGIGQSSGWFGVNGMSEFKGVNGINVNGINGNGHAMNTGANPGSAPGAEFSLPTPDSVSHGPFGAFGTSVGSMGISPKDTVTAGTRKDDGNVELDPAAKQAAIVSEKRRRRRESHNAVERRRRDNINEKISELATLIPQVMLDPTSPISTNAGVGDDRKEKDFDGDDADDAEKPSSPPAKSKTGKGEKGEKDGGGQPVKANKGMILRKSVEYIRYLQQLVGAQAVRNRELEARLAEAGIVPPAPSEPMPMALPGADTNPQADELAGIFGAEGLHAFDDRAMELGVNGMGHGINGGFATQFGALEPMAEMDMEMEMDVEGMHEINGKRMGNSGTGSSDAGDDREQDEPEHDMENERDQDRGSSVSASAVSDASSPQERRDASSDRSEEQNIGSLTSDREERGRRGRDGKVHISGAGVHKSPSVSSLTGRMSRRRSKLVAVKEESTGMEV